MCSADSSAPACPDDGNQPHHPYHHTDAFDSSLKKFERTVEILALNIHAFSQHMKSYDWQASTAKVGPRGGGKMSHENVVYPIRSRTCS